MFWNMSFESKDDFDADVRSETSTQGDPKTSEVAEHVQMARDLVGQAVTSWEKGVLRDYFVNIQGHYNSDPKTGLPTDLQRITINVTQKP